MDAEPEGFDRVLSSMCTEPHPAARAAAERFLATNPGDPASFPTAGALEDRAVELLGRVVGLEEPEGYVTGGGTEANVQAVRLARDRVASRTPNVVVPTSAHFSFRKAASMLDVELREVPTDAGGRVNLDAAETSVDADTALVVGVAGSTARGRVDPIPALVDLAHGADALCHVDAAWGGFVLPFTDHEWSFADAPIDSMAIDPHKFGRAAIPAGGLLVRDEALLDVLAVETPYLETATQVTLSGTRSGAGVASAVAAMETLWPDGYEAQFERAWANATWLFDAIEELGLDVAPPTLPLVAIEDRRGAVERLRGLGWRVSRTDDGTLRIVCMPHVDRSTLETFVEDLASVATTAGTTAAGRADR